MIPLGTSLQSDYYIREIGNILYDPIDTGKEYKFFYTGYNNPIIVDSKIFYAYSSNGKDWTKYAGNPVISDNYYEDPYIVKSGNTYYLYAEDVLAVSKIRRWHSSDCVTWIDDGLITGVATACASPLAWIEGATWYLLYENMVAGGVINLATSSDGLAWTDEATNPVFTVGDTSWCENPDIAPDEIVKIDATYYLTYHNWNGHYGVGSGIATSTDLKTWTDSANSPITSLITTVNGGVIYCAMPYSIGANTAFLYEFGDDDFGIFLGYPTKA